MLIYNLINVYTMDKSSDNGSRNNPHISHFVNSASYSGPRGSISRSRDDTMVDPNNIELNVNTQESILDTHTQESILNTHRIFSEGKDISNNSNDWIQKETTAHRNIASKMIEYILFFFDKIIGYIFNSTDTIFNILISFTIIILTLMVKHDEIDIFANKDSNIFNQYTLFKVENATESASINISTIVPTLLIFYPVPGFMLGIIR